MEPVTEYWGSCHAHTGSFLLAVRVGDEIEVRETLCPECGGIPDRIAVKPHAGWRRDEDEQPS